jgi:hypothetical protein
MNDWEYWDGALDLRHRRSLAEAGLLSVLGELATNSNVHECLGIDHG